jgi:hypothetical protein
MHRVIDQAPNSLRVRSPSPLAPFLKRCDPRRFESQRTSLVPVSEAQCVSGGEGKQLPASHPVIVRAGIENRLEVPTCPGICVRISRVEG